MGNVISKNLSFVSINTLRHDLYSYMFRVNFSLPSKKVCLHGELDCIPTKLLRRKTIVIKQKLLAVVIRFLKTRQSHYPRRRFTSLVDANIK